MQVSKPEAGAPRRGGLGRGIKLALGLLLSALFLYATLAAVPFARVVDVLAGAKPLWIAAALLCILVGYLLKIYRWTLMLRSLGARVGVAQTATPFLGGVAFNNVLPLRAGDVIRVVAFRRFTGVPASGQIGTLLLERLLDLFVLMLFLFATVSFWRITALDETLLAGARLAAFAVAAAILMFVAAPKPIQLIVRWAENRLPRLRPAGEALLRLSTAVAALSRPLFLLRVTLISILAWVAEGSAFLMVGLSLGVAPTVPAALLAVSLGTLSTIIPSSPGYVGTFHYFTAKAVAAFGAGQAGAAAYAILIHAILWLTTTATGFLLLASSSFRTKRVAAAAPARE
jgi:uncharacterized protein (TIRG00374 family)